MKAMAVVLRYRYRMSAQSQLIASSETAKRGHAYHKIFYVV